ncbi:type IV secretory system conjugative DNA transfer family protein [Mesorhizobium sp.]|uniref:type IV secretory system conjugative DNA transfer family protein n=1 Tax=Mesorhizobium sp. TaxID=1871066 RepID=UPI000FE92885|nr:type IV secretory system conjugative DNA transfer family protein [Mesorhizobium sp.]RWA81730.1 MAG: type IV secretory system conjugative DNA transfer family protein [Mesorhizobium sp.]
MTGLLRALYLTFSLAIGYLVWTLCYGIALQLIYRDGRMLSATITADPMAPLWQLMAYPDSGVLRTVAFLAIVPALSAAALVAYAGLRPVSHPLGDAQFQDAMSLRKAGWFGKKGHILGRYGKKILRVDDERHHLVIGPTRSGKGAGYVVPNALTYEGSMVVTDLKGEIFKSTAGHRKSRGNQVFLFAPGSARTHRYNPLDFIRTDRGERTTDIQNIASILVPETVDSENAIWQATAQQVMAGVISYVCESVYYEGRRNLAEVNSFFNSGVNLQALMARVREAEPYLSRFTLESFNAYLALSERAAASALLDIQKALRPFRNERIAAATSVTDMDLRALKHRPITIYLSPGITDITLLKPLLALFVQQLLDLLMLDHGHRTVPVYFLLDEFRQLKKMSEITTKLPYVAGYNIKIAFVIQDLKNLDEIYGETARHSLMGNCGYQLVYGANDQVTAETVSKSLGKRTVRYTTESRAIELMGLHRRTKVEQLRERDLMMPQEVRQLSADRTVILAEAQAPVLADKLRFFRQKPFYRMETFSRAHTPEVPAVELMPPTMVPALKDSYRRGPADRDPHPTAFAEPPTVNTTGEGGQLSSALPVDGMQPADPSDAPPTGDPSHSAPAYSNQHGSISNDAKARMLEANFTKAARKLRTIVREKSKAEGSASGRDWGAIFDATVPDPAEQMSLD